MKYIKILVLDNEVQAQLLGALLTEQNIPHFLKSYHDSAYDGLFQAQLGWGHLEAPEHYREAIESLYEDVLNPDPGPVGET